jgi:hypothetical protein
MIPTVHYAQTATVFHSYDRVLAACPAVADQVAGAGHDIIRALRSPALHPRFDEFV